MSKRKYDQYGDDELGSKHAPSRHISNSHMLNNTKKYFATVDSNPWRDSKENLNQGNNPLSQDAKGPTDNICGGRANKVTNLLHALDEYMLFESENAGHLSAPTVNTTSLCEALRMALIKQRSSLSSTSIPMTAFMPAPGTYFAGSAGESLLQVLPPLALTPWSSASIPKALPGLPKIKSPALEKAAFTHSGVTSNAGALSYERLEWLGDAYIYLVSTILISSTFTSHLPGKCAQIREILVKNETLASYARHYGFEKRAHLPPEFSDENHKGYRAKETEKVKVMGDIFEAYVAAVILSDPEQGVNNISSWLKNLWAQTISKKIKEQEGINEKAKAIPVGDTHANLNPKDRLSRKIGAKGVKVSYRDVGPEKKDPATGFPLFTIGVFLEGWGEHDKQLGIGKALGKKDAGMKAAEMALANKKLMTSYEEMKRVHDEKLRVEKEMAADEGSNKTVAVEKPPGGH